MSNVNLNDLVHKELRYPFYEDIVKVKLVSYSQPTEEFSFLKEDGADLGNLITYCARVSNPNNQTNMETSDKLINYLIRNKHWSPFEMVNVCLEITSTRDIVRQILRHASFRFQEYSQRYANPVEDLEFCIREYRIQDTKNRQKSIEIDPNNTEDCWKMYDWYLTQQEVIDKVKEEYTSAINKGIAKEVARVILPEGNTISRAYMSGSIRSFIHYCEVRCGNGTQKEHSLIALEIAKVVKEIFGNFPIEVPNDR